VLSWSSSTVALAPTTGRPEFMSVTNTAPQPSATLVCTTRSVTCTIATSRESEGPPEMATMRISGRGCPFTGSVYVNGGGFRPNDRARTAMSTLGLRASSDDGIGISVMCCLFASSFSLNATFVVSRRPATARAAAATSDITIRRSESGTGMNAISALSTLMWVRRMTGR